MMKLMTMTMKTMTRICSERSWQAITSSTLHTGMKSLIQVQYFWDKISNMKEHKSENVFNILPSACHVYIPIHLQNKTFLLTSMCFFSLTAKSLVARLMEVDQDQRLTAQEAINHEW